MQVIRFTATRTFDCDELGSTYCEGLSYTALPQDAVLQRLIPGWVQDGRIVLSRGGSTISGRE